MNAQQHRLKYEREALREGAAVRHPTAGVLHAGLAASIKRAAERREEGGTRGVVGKTATPWRRLRAHHRASGSKLSLKTWARREYGVTNKSEAVA